MRERGREGGRKGTYRSRQATGSSFLLGPLPETRRISFTPSEATSAQKD